MPTVIINFTDAQISSLLSLASDLRAHFAKKRPVVKSRGKQRHPHKIDVSMDPWVDLFANVEGERVSTRELVHRHVGSSAPRVSPVDGARIAACMRELGWFGPLPIWIDGKTVRGYRRNPSVFTKM